MPFVEDFKPFFKTSEFASDATLAGVSVSGIFDNGYQAFQVGPEVFATGPVFLLPTSDVPANVTSQSLVVSGETWSVVEVEPDGTGLTLLRLRKP